MSVDSPTFREDELTGPQTASPAQGPKLRAFNRLERGEINSLILVGRYRVERWLARGGMASVFVGEELATGRGVAIKILDDRGEDTHHLLLRFIREACVGEQIRHPNVVEILDWGTTPEGVMYLVMELLHGEDLRTVIDREGCLSWTRTRKLMLQLCAAVEAVHRTGVVHCDLKPANCHLSPTHSGAERLVLVDFGVAVRADGLRTQPANPEVVGTPEYMAPEQARAEPVDERTDVYAAGIVLCELLTGTTPFRGQGVTAVLEAQIYEQPDPLRQLAPGTPAIDPRIERVYARALAKVPGERFASIRALAQAIAAIPEDADHCPPSSRASTRPARASSSMAEATGF